MNDDLIPVSEVGLPVTDHEFEAAIDALPFVSSVNNSREFWSTTPVGHAETDIARGEQYAELAIGMSRLTGSHLILAFVMRDIIRSGRFDALEAGFIATIASAARAGALN